MTISFIIITIRLLLARVPFDFREQARRRTALQHFHFVISVCVLLERTRANQIMTQILKSLTAAPRKRRQFHKSFGT